MDRATFLPSWMSRRSLDFAFLVCAGCVLMGLRIQEAAHGFMKRKLVITALVLLGAMVLTAIGYGVAALSLSAEPAGMFASYEFFPHDRLDVLEYRDGKVTSRTCCGDQSMGTYLREADGRWLWTYTEKRWVGTPRWKADPVGKYEKVTRRFVLRPTPLLLHVENLDDPSESWDMRRRLFAKFPL
jgi:hypothetical protein